MLELDVFGFDIYPVVDSREVSRGVIVALREAPQIFSMTSALVVSSGLPEPGSPSEASVSARYS